MSDLRGWPALILTAGLATRLRPLSDVRAKAAMPVAGASIIERILRWLRSSGVRRVVVNLHHKPQSITSIVGDGSQCDLHVRYSWERIILGSAGGPRHALPLLESDRFLIINGDTLTNCDLSAVVECHLASTARVTMAVVPGDVERYGGVLIDQDNRVCGFSKPNDYTRALHFIGVQAVDADVFASLPDGEPAETVRALYPALIRARADAIAAYENTAEFLDVGTARDYLNTVATVALREGRPFDVGQGCSIDPRAEIERTVIWDRVTIGAGSRLVNCVLADGVTLPDGASYSNSVLVHTPVGVSVYQL